MPRSESAAPLVADPVPDQSIPKPKSQRKQRSITADLIEEDGNLEALVTDPAPRKRAKRKPSVPVAHSSDADGPEQSESVSNERDLPLVIHAIDHPAVESINSAQAVLSQVLGAGRYAKLPQFGPDALLGLRLNQLPLTDADPYRALVLHGYAGDIELSDGVRLLMALTGIDLGESAVEIPESQWLSASALGRLAGTPLQDIISLSRGCLVPGSEYVTLCLSLHSGQHAFSMTAKASVVCWLDLLARASWLHNGRVVENQLDLPLTIRWRIGTHPIARSVLDGMVAGDIVLPETCWFDCSGLGLVRIGSWQLSVMHTAPAGMTLLSLETRMDSLGTIVDTDSLFIHPPLAGTNETGGLDTLPLQVHFDMGCCHTTLGGLRTLVAGSVLPIEGGSPATIGISTGGRTLGQGKLVEVNGKLAVRITYWS
jgi:type III secretion protein Q